MLTLDEIEKKLVGAKNPKDLFGDDIELGLANLQVMCHPDKFTDPDQRIRAEELFKRIGAFADKAKKPKEVIRSKKHSYVIESQLAVGDIADIHDAGAYLLKISRVQGAEKYLEREHEVLVDLYKMAKDETYRHYFPMPIESFPVRHKFQRRINVFQNLPEFLTLETLLTKRPQLEGEHIAWIFKRLLTAIGFAHNCGHLHGAILPSHVMIRPANHAVQLIGWGQSVKKSEKIQIISSKYRDWYAPEVLNKNRAEPATDIYMAARCMIELAGGMESHHAKVPDKMVRFIKSLLLPGVTMRPHRAWDLMDEFTDFLAALYGPPKFVRLHV